MFGKKKKRQLDYDQVRELMDAMDRVKEMEKIERVERKIQRKEKLRPPPEPPPEYEEPEPEPEEVPVMKPIPKKEIKEEREHEYRMMGKYLLKELPLFKYEIIIYIVIAVIAFMLYILDRTGLVEGIVRVAVIPAIALPMVIWFIKWMRYTPRKNKVPSLRIYKSGVIELGVDNISKGYINYGKGEDAKRKYITRLAKHTEASTGKPFLVTSELHGENIDLIEENKPDMRSDEFNAILDTEKAVVTKSVMARMMRFAQPNWSNPLVILGIIQLAMLAVVLVKTLNILPSLK